MWIAAGPAEAMGGKEEQKEETSRLRPAVLRLLADRAVGHESQAASRSEGKSHNVPSASKEMVVITDFSLTFVAFRFAEKGRER
jgi:hypothetical protein